MRTTWIILLFMVLTGAAMYYLSTRKDPPGPYDSISLTDTTRGMLKKIKVFMAANPVEVMYIDTLGWRKDSLPLKKILDGSRLNFFNKKYDSIALYFTYDDRYFYDLEIGKKNPETAYDIRFHIVQKKDSLFVEGNIDTHQDLEIIFNGPMIRMFPEFAVIYNYKLPPPEPDSLEPVKSGPQPTKTISVLRK